MANEIFLQEAARYAFGYNKARKEIEAPFSYLPHAPSLLIQLLITRANPTTGLVENLTYRDLAKLMSIDHAPGRKNAGTPKAETIRSYLRTIAKSCTADFRLISQGQKLKCQFINMTAIYAHYFASEEVYRQNDDSLTSSKNLIQPDENREITSAFDKGNEGEGAIVAQKNSPAKNINILTNKQNKLTPAKANAEIYKKPISPDFYPSTETIATALHDGLIRVTDFTEIKKFIAYNTEQETLWPDFNPVFLAWLQRDKEHTAKKNTVSTQGYSRRSGHERVRTTYSNNSYESAMALVAEANKDAWSPSESLSASTIDVESEAYCLALAAIDSDLRTTFY